MKPWYESFFDEWYRYDYGKIVTEEVTEAQVGFIMERLELSAGMRLLDLCCGRGRHALALARRGIEVVGQDLHAPAVEAAARQAVPPTQFFCRDMRDIPYDAHFDAVINMFTAFGYFDEIAEDEKVLQAVHRALRPGGRFLIDFISLAGLMRRYDPKDFQQEPDGTMSLQERSYDPLTGFNEVRILRIAPDGTRTESHHRVRIYAPHELARMLTAAGFAVDRLYGDFRGTPWSLDSIRLIVLAHRV